MNPGRQAGDWRVWLEAARPKTLPAAVIPVLVATALAAAHRSASLPKAAVCLGFALLVQIGTNFTNDYFDFVHGADNPRRVGPRRAVAAGLIAPERMRRAMAWFLPPPSCSACCWCATAAGGCCRSAC